MYGAVSVSPYTWVTSQPRSPSSRSIVAAAGGAPAVMTRTPGGTSPRTSGEELASEMHTVGAAHMRRTSSSLIKPNTVAGSTFRRHTCVPAAAVTVHVNVQPLAWNIGSVHRYASPTGIGRCRRVPMVFRAAFRWVIITPLGRDVVPLV
jgi:hypothetical protein